MRDSPHLDIRLYDFTPAKVGVESSNPLGRATQDKTANTDVIEIVT